MQRKRNIYESGKGNSVMSDQKILEYAQHRYWDSHTYGNIREKCFPRDITSNHHMEMNIENTLFDGWFCFGVGRGF